MNNCPECGAALLSIEMKCPICRTVFIDISDIDINDVNHDQVWLRFKAGNTIITQKAIPTLLKSNLSKTSKLYYENNTRYAQKIESYTFETIIKFDAIEHNGKLFTMETEDENERN